MKKFNFALSVTDIGSWVNDNSQELLEKSILDADTIKYVSIYPGVKYKEQLKFLSTDSLFQSYSCGTPTTSGTTTISSKDLEVKPYMIFEELCPSDLNSTSLNLSQTPGIDTNLPFEGQYVQLKAKEIKKKIENKFWYNVSGATEFSGLIQLFDADDDVVDYTYDFSATGITDSALISAYEDMIDKIPEEVIGMEDLTLFLGHDEFRKLSRAFLNTNNTLLQKFDFNGVDVFEFPGAEYLKIRPVNGLNASNNTDHRVFITPASNILFVCDMMSEEDKSKMWWSEDDQKLKFLATFKFAPNYKFGEYVVASKKS